MTAGLSYHCQQLIACCHLTVKGFLFEQEVHCVSAQVMRLFFIQQHKSANRDQSLCRFCSISQPSPIEKELVPLHDTFFLLLYPWDNLYCLCCQRYCPTKDKQTDRPESVQYSKVAGLPWAAFRYHQSPPEDLNEEESCFGLGRHIPDNMLVSFHPSLQQNTALNRISDTSVIMRPSQ